MPDMPSMHVPNVPVQWKRTSIKSAQELQQIRSSRNRVQTRSSTSNHRRIDDPVKVPRRSIYPTIDNTSGRGFYSFSVPLFHKPGNTKQPQDSASNTTAGLPLVRVSHTDYGSEPFFPTPPLSPTKHDVTNVSETGGRIVAPPILSSSTEAERHAVATFQRPEAVGKLGDLLGTAPKDSTAKLNATPHPLQGMAKSTLSLVVRNEPNRLSAFIPYVSPTDLSTEAKGLKAKNDTQALNEERVYDRRPSVMTIQSDPSTAKGE